MNVSLLTCHSITNPLNLELARLTAPNHAAYATRQGYSQQILRMDWEPSKLAFLLELRALLPRFDLVLTHGSDVLMMNQSIRVEDVCARLKHTRGVMFSREGHTDWPVNNDVGIWWHDADSLAVLDRLIADHETWRDYPWIWQNHLWNLLQTDPAFASRVKLALPRDMNAAPGGDNEARWKIGDWICHLLGCDEATKIPAAKLMLKKVSPDGCYHHPGTLFLRHQRLSRRNPRAVFIGIPSYKPEMHFQAGQSIVALQIWAAHKLPDWQIFIKQLVGTGVPKLRDNLVSDALTAVNPRSGRADYGKLLMIDSDIGFNPLQVAQLIQQPHPIIGGLYPLKTKPLAWVWQPKPGAKPDQRGVQLVAGLGTGFKCFDLAVFEAYAEAHPELAYTNNDLGTEYAGRPMTLFFREDIVDGNRMPEDFYFDRKCQELGIPVAADTKLHLGHFGDADWLAVNKALT